MNKFIKSIVILAACGFTSVVWAASTTTQAENSVAAIGTVTSAGVDTFTAFYSDLTEAFAALENGTKAANYKLTLLKDVALSDGIVFDNKNSSADLANDNNSRREWYIIDLNNHKISLANSEKYLLTIKATASSAYNSIGIRNGTLEATGTTLGALNVEATRIPRVTKVTMSSENADNPTCVFAGATSNCLVKDCDISNSNGGIALSICGKQALVHGSTIVSESGTALYVSQTDETRTGTAVAKCIVRGETAVEVGENACEYVYLTGERFEGALVDNAGCLWISGGTYTTDESDYYRGAGYTHKENADGTYTVIEDNAVTVDGEVSTISAAFAVKGKTGSRTIQLQDDIFLLALDEGVNAMDIGKDMTVTIDLNNHSLYVFDVSAFYKDVKCAAISEGGTLNITDTSDDKTGYVGFYAWLMDFRNANYNGPQYANNMVTLAGTMTIDAGTFDNLSFWCCGYTLATYTVDIYPGYSATKLGGNLTIAGTGKLLHTNTAVRMFSGDYKASITMTGGTIDGGLTAIWQNGCYNATIDISGGELIGTGGYGVIYNQYESKASSSTTTISGGTFTGIVAAYGASYHSAGWFMITGGSFIAPKGEDFYLYGPSGTLVAKGGVYDRIYLQYYNFMRHCSKNEWSLYVTIDGTVRVENDNRYHFGPEVAVTYDSNFYLGDAFSSLSLALKNAGTTLPSYPNGDPRVVGNYVDLMCDDVDSVAQTISTTLNPVVWLNGHSVTSAETEPLMTISNGAFEFIADEGSITSGGPVFKTTSRGQVVIQDGNYTTSGSALFDGYGVYVMADVGDGSYFDVNPASFSHDVSSFVYNKLGAIEFKTIQAPIDSRYYLGRNVEVVKEQN